MTGADNIRKASDMLDAFELQALPALEEMERIIGKITSRFRDASAAIKGDLEDGE